MTHRMKEFVTVLEENGLCKEFNLYEKEEQEISCFTYNSKEVSKDTCFVCKGAAFKPEYLEESIGLGATLYISEQKYETKTTIPYILTTDIRKAMGVLGDFFYNSPAKKLNLIGIGGTKGKSTTAYYIKSILDEYMEATGGKETAIISSIDVYDGVIRQESHITTPEAMELHKHFHHAVDSSIEYMEMEVSSQALKYDRVYGITFDAGVFLNIGEDHISPIEHADFEDYFQSKLKMFAQTKHAFVSTGTDFFERVMDAAKESETVTTFGLTTDADFYGYDVKKDGEGILFRVRCKDFDEPFALSMPGFFNVENALAAIAVAHSFHIPLEYIISGILHAKSSGRMEIYPSKDKKVIAIVDYAHNKLSFDKLFSSMKQEYPDYDIISIFGCPGKKAYIRRKDLGTIAGQYSKKVYLCAEDPGSEPVEDISMDIAQYVKAQNCPYELIEKRGEAIKKAIFTAENKSLLLITGKGNETRQKYGTEYLDCVSDVEYTKMYIEQYDKMHS